jgi:hypothetical protein
MFDIPPEDREDPIAALEIAFYTLEDLIQKLDDREYMQKMDFIAK